MVAADRFTLEVEIPAMGTWLPVAVLPGGSLETCDEFAAREGLDYWRREYPASSFRLLRWRAEVLETNAQ